MAGRRTFFSFHYQRDIWRTNVVRNAGVVDAKAAAGWQDASLWEEAKKKGDGAVKSMINDALFGTSVTVVLIGCMTSARKYVNYEIKTSIERGNGLLGLFIHGIKDKGGNIDAKGAIPNLLVEEKVPCYNWDKDKFGSWIEKAAVRAGKPCLAHGEKSCKFCG